MALSIKIGTGSNIYTDVAQAFANRGNQKLSIVGTGADILTDIAALNTAAAGIGSIKATSDVQMTAANAASYKAAILKFGTKSLVVSDTAANIGTNYTALDAVYNKTKSLVSTTTPVGISADQLTLSKSLAGIQNLVGRGNFNVTAADATDFKENLTALLANASKIGTITMTAGTGEVTAAQLGVLGSKMSAASMVVSDTADNLLSVSALANYTTHAAKVATINVTKASLAQVGHIGALITATTLATAKMGDTVIQDTAAKLNNSTDLATAITAASGWAAGAATISKVIIDGTGQGATTKAILDGIYGKATSVVAFGNAAGANTGALTYLGKALDIEKNLAVLVENQGTAVVAGTGGPVAKITVADGNIAAKKQFTVTLAQHTALNAAFTAGQASSTNTNYGYIVSGVASANAATFQANAKVTSFTVTGLAAGDADTTAKLVSLLGNSKLKTATTASGYTVAELATTRTQLSAVASNTDRAKLKIIA
jgi:hypothetical protein